MRFPATDAVAAPGVPGALYLQLAGETGPLQGGIYRPAHWAHNSAGYYPNPPSGISGLWQEVPDPDRPGRFLGTRALGTGTGHFDINLSPGGVWVGSAGEVIEVRATLALNGTPIDSLTVTGTIPGWVIAIFPDLHFVGTIDVIENDVLTAGVTVSKTPAIYAYSSGTGQQTIFNVSGSLAGAPPEDEPSFAMRGSATVRPVG